MRIVIITQDDPFYLPRNLDFLLSNLPAEAEVAACIVTKVSPFGKKESFIDKMKRTISIFGLHFFVKYGLDFALSKLPFRPTVRSVLKKHCIPEVPIYSSLNSKESLAQIGALKPDLLISIAGNEIFRRPLIDLAPKGCLNLHTALLPKYRGLMPSFWVLMNREQYTGVSVFYVDEGIDSGPILVQERVEIGNMTQRELITHTKLLGMKAILNAIKKILAGQTETLPNEEAESTYFKFPTRQDVKKFKQVGARFF